MDIRAMKREEVDWAVQLAAKEGWNPGLSDAECFYRTDPEGFLIGLLDGEPVGCISAVRYPEGFGFMGFYIVLPEHRGKGYSLDLWKVAMDRMQGYNAGGDGVVEMIPKYLSAGFNLAYRNIRYGGSPPSLARNSPDVVQIGPNSDGLHVTFDEVAAYDRRCFPAPRDSFLRCWLNNPSYAVVSDGRLKGYGTIRRCWEGFKIGPLFADDAAVADELFRALCHRTDGEGPVFLDVPEPNAAAVKLAESNGLKKVFETARIYTGPAPDIDLDKVFGVTTFELG
ncbi:GCN5-related N-acetyltransferase [Fimbriimonas ginsengisoli Gsoil 348]|uniref:GCN5-related N-acetyltransferase n=1 Tax=Fimbriimonas ginsengisoli Gsoil 348 TaxID=661478 RepID=A0A068NKC4_FIMGI|nr:GCN5-related N-acetyltransferase [Fimbriimonas ginsengisoli Gsoil 348]